MKKKYNYLLILAIICLILTTLLCFSTIIFDDFSFSATKEVMNTVNTTSKDNPGIGWYFLLAGGTAVTVDLLTGITVIALVIFLPIAISLLALIFQALARTFQIGNETKWKNITSKILAIIGLFIQLILCIVLILNIMSSFDVSNIILYLVLLTNIIGVILGIKKLAIN